MNALKHGMRSRKLALLRDESIAFENRRLKWMANADAQDDIEEFLIYQNVSLSFELERVDQARHERIIAEIESSDDDDFVAVHQLGKRLFFDPGGPTPMYGNRPEFDPTPRTSGAERVSGDQSQRLRGTHPLPEDGRSGQERQVDFMPTSDLSWISSTRGSDSSRHLFRKCGTGE